MKNQNKQFERYLDILGVKKNKPSYEYLCELVKAHLLRIPFENLSKLIYKKAGMDHLPGLEIFLDGVEKHNLGGTCYTNNYHLFGLIEHLGFDVKLCGADMKYPDVHLISMVKIKKKEFIVDGGYAAPFFDPLPRFLKQDHTITFGAEKFIVKPKDKDGYTRLDQYYNEEHKHWYVAKPEPRTIDDFSDVIKDSYSDAALFMNIIRITRFTENGSFVLRNRNLVKTEGEKTTTSDIPRDELPLTIENKFLIPSSITEEAIEYLKNSVTNFHF